jgi:hypothetical protein
MRLSDMGESEAARFARIHSEIEDALYAFRFSHLPPHLREVSRPFAAMAAQIADGSHNEDTVQALHHLRRAKDCAVSAQLDRSKTYEELWQELRQPEGGG